MHSLNLSSYEIRVGRSKSVSGPFVDQSGVELLEGGGGTTVYASNANKEIFAPGGPGVLNGDSCTGDILYYHYCQLVSDITC